MIYYFNVSTVIIHSPINPATQNFFALTVCSPSREFITTKRKMICYCPFEIGLQRKSVPIFCSFAPMASPAWGGKLCVDFCCLKVSLKCNIFCNNKKSFLEVDLYYKYLLTPTLPSLQSRVLCTSTYICCQGYGVRNYRKLTAEYICWSITKALSTSTPFTTYLNLTNFFC